MNNNGGKRMNGAQIALAIIDRPKRAMQGAAANPSSWWIAAVLLIIGLVVYAAVSAPYGVELANERSERMIDQVTQSMSDEQAEMVRERAAGRLMTTRRYLLTTAGGGIVLAGMGWALRGGIVHFGSMVFGGTSAWPATLAITVWSLIPTFVRQVVQTVYLLVNQELVTHQGLAFAVSTGDWLKDSRSVQYALLSQVDPFALWHLLLLSVGIAVATRVSAGKAAALAVLVWLVFAGLALLPVVIGRSFMG